MTRKVALVTGASGLIGAQTIAPLRALGFEVHALCRRRPTDPDIPHIAVDLRDPTQIDIALAALRPTHILHCAWDVTHGRFWEAPENIDWIAATLTLARAATRHGTARFVGVGTGVEYDWTDRPGIPRREDDPTRPTSLYGIAKDHTRALLAALFARTGTSFAWGRVFDLFGPGEAPDRLIAALVRTLREGGTFVCRHGQLERDYMAAADVGIALAHLTVSAAQGPVNIASGSSIALGDLARQVAAIVDGPGLLVVETLPAPGQTRVMRVNNMRLYQELYVLPPRPLTEHLRDLARH